MVKPGKPVRAVVYPGDHAAGHAWAYLPDLADIEHTFPAAESVHFGGHWIEPGVEFAKAIGRAAGCPDAKIRPAPWLMLRLGSPFVELFRELLEMRHLWQVHVRLDSRKLCMLIGEEPHTPLPRALGDVLTALGCIPERAQVST
jgi:nucleoside-diphosphate-sugar epimerase